MLPCENVLKIATTKQKKRTESIITEQGCRLDTAKTSMGTTENEKRSRSHRTSLGLPLNSTPTQPRDIGLAPNLPTSPFLCLNNGNKNSNS